MVKATTVVWMAAVLLAPGCRPPRGQYDGGNGKQDAPALAAVQKTPDGPSGSKPEHVGDHHGTRVWLLLQVADEVARTDSRTVEADDSARLGVVVQRKGRFYSDLEDVVVEGRRLGGDELQDLAELPGFQKVWWYKVEAKKNSYMNSSDNEGWWADIRYGETLFEMGEEGMVGVDVAPTRHDGVRMDGVQLGTMRFKASVEMEDFVLCTPGARSRGKAGTLPGVLRVSRKGGTGHRIVDHALSLANLPYIWGSAPVKGKSHPGSHQSEQYIGADCADMVVAAWRLSGASDLEYSGAVPMVRQLASTGHGIRVGGRHGGVLLDGSDREIRLGPGGARPGSAVMWRFGPSKRKGHSALLVRDRGRGGEPDGMLGDEDLVLHTMWDTPRLQPLGEVMGQMIPVAVINPVLLDRGKRWIEVDLDTQTLTAMQDGKQVYSFPISSGKDGSTPTGTFRIWRKHRLRDMKVGLVVLGRFFVLEDVPWILYYEGEGAGRARGFAIHGAYWHDDFGAPVSHGCINLDVQDARVLYRWAGPVAGVDFSVTATEDNPGTPVIVRGKTLQNLP